MHRGGVSGHLPFRRLDVHGLSRYVLDAGIRQADRLGDAPQVHGAHAGCREKRSEDEVVARRNVNHLELVDIDHLRSKHAKPIKKKRGGGKVEGKRSKTASRSREQSVANESDFKALDFTGTQG